MCKENPELDGDGIPKLLPKDGGNRRVDSETWFYLKFSTLIFLILIFFHF